MSRAVKLDKRILETIRAYKSQRAMVFGSMARGTADETSDIDLMIIKETKRPFLERLKEFALLLPDGLPRVDAFIYTPEEFGIMKDWGNPLVERVLSEGEVIYEAP